MPLLLDEMDNAAGTAFAAWPERLVVAGADGRIAYPGRPGPLGFSPEEAEEQLAALLGRHRTMSSPVGAASRSRHPGPGARHG